MRRAEEEADWFAAKATLLGSEPLRALERVRATIERRHGATPHFDPHDGGAQAELLLLLETPGPGRSPLRFVSRDNPTGTGRNLARFCDAAGLSRAQTVVWNVVPWIIHRPGDRNRAPTAGEIDAGLALLPPVLAVLPRLRVAVLAGRVPARAEPMIRAHGLPVLRMPHPSPIYVNTKPDIAPGIVATLAAARALLAAPPQSLKAEPPRDRDWRSPDPSSSR